MTMMKIVIPLLMTICAFPPAGRAELRPLPRVPDVETLSIGFNGETLKCFVLLIDCRTDREKTADSLRGQPAGPSLVFFQGHAQRPDDAYGFTSRLARMSRSGIVVIPVCDTPCGSDPGWHGDTGKDVVLMEMVRIALAREGLSVEEFKPITDMPVFINDPCPVTREGEAGTRLVSIGWSHGGILARRFAHAYPASVCSLGQVCPAGYEQWGPWELTGRFSLESLRIFARMGNAHAAEALGSAWGFTKGFTGDLFRSIPGALIGLNPGKAGRVFRDIHDCCTYCDSASYKASHLDRIAVLFAAGDSCMDPVRQLGIRDLSRMTSDDLLRFHRTFFGDVIEPERLSLKILPGTHMAPVSHAGLYAETLLAELGELAEY